MGGVEIAALGGGEDQPVHRLLAREVESGRSTRDVAVLDLEVFRASEVVVAGADQEDEIAVLPETSAEALAVVVEHPDHADHRRRIDRRLAARVVVQAHVAAHDREVESAAGVGEAGNRLLHLPIHLGPVGLVVWGRNFAG